MVNRRGRYAYRIVNDRMRVSDSLVKQLAALGLERVERPPVDLGTYLSQRRASAATAGSATQPGRGDHGSDQDVDRQGDCGAMRPPGPPGQKAKKLKSATLSP